MKSVSDQVIELEDGLDDANDEISRLKEKIAELEDELNQPLHCTMCKNLIKLKK